MRATTTPVAEHSGTLERLDAVEYTGMVRLAYTLVGSNAEAEDLVQDSFGDESPGDGPGSVAFSDYLIGVSDDNDVLGAGLVTGGTDIRWSGMRRGTGVYEGQLVAENGWAAFDDPGSPDSSVTGVIQLTVLPVDG